MLELKPTTPFSWKFIITEDGADAGVLDLKRVRGTGTFTFRDASFAIKRAGFFAPYTLNDEKHEIATGRRSKLVPPTFTITAQDRELRVVSAFFFPKQATIFHGDVAIGTMTRDSIFRRAVTVEYREATPPPLMIFAATMIILHWRRRSRS